MYQHPQPISPGESIPSYHRSRADLVGQDATPEEIQAAVGGAAAGGAAAGGAAAGNEAVAGGEAAAGGAAAVPVGCPAVAAPAAPANEAVSVLWLSVPCTVTDLTRLLVVKLLPEVPLLLALTSDHAVSPLHDPLSRR